MDYRSIIESRYNRTRWQELLHDIFRHNVQFWQQPQHVPVDENVAKKALYTGKISLPDGHVIAIYEVELSDKVVIERNRAGIRNLLCTSWRGMGCTGAFMFCYRHEESVLRFSYVSESYAFAEDGSIKKESTDTKRFTYLLGEGHRSRTAIRQFEELKKSALDLKAITKAFSVEALSDIFFKEYKNHYENIIEYVTGKRMVKVANKWEEQETGKPCHEIMQEFSCFPDAEKAIRDYVKKLMGRLVFIQVLQKKGWMGCSAGEAWNDGVKEFIQNLFAKSAHKDTFVDDILEPLFHDINTKRDGDITSSTNIGNGIKIPYLNGGLFEKDDYDNTAFPLPAKFIKELLDFFANYNFTIDENDPDDAEIGVDPEMLGRIFENLLEDNKDKGAFYTPKEIVHYMCRESLIAYLQTDILDDAAKDAVRQFVTTYDAAALTDDQKATIDQKLKDVKICDPAIGSGAFPMGLLRELYACRKAIEGIDDETAVSIKTHIIQNNIYGVDIEKGAVDIARLRFWLALIVDEKTPHALPNMDFKIMQGNSLLEQYEGVELSGMSLNEQTQKKTKKGQAWQQLFAFDEQDSLKNIQNAIREYYNTDEHDRKVELRNIINSNVKSYIINLKGCTEDIKQKLEALPIPNDQFFLWHIYFKEVFDKGGFDIVIGNPPYFVYQAQHANEIETLRKDKDYSIAFGGKLNAYKLFLANAFKKLIKKNGINCFIFQNSFLGDKQATNLRKFILDNAQIIDIESFPERDSKKKRIFESVKMSVCIPIIRNTKSNKEFVVNIWDDKYKTNGLSTCFTSDDIKAIDNIDFVIPRLKKEYKNVVIKMISKKSLELKCYEGELNVTFHKKFFNQLSTNPTILKGASIQKYYYTLKMSQGQIEYLEEESYLDKYGNSEKAKHHNYERIAMQGMTGANDKLRIIMTIVPAGFYLGNSCNYILPQQGINSKVLLGILNSKAINWFFRCFSTNSNVNGYEVENMPIPHVGDKIQCIIVEKIDAIMSAKQQNPQADTSALEAEIDQLVYKLYDLTPDEIAIIEKA
ncbi:MAG: N-6 DNA methylase [Bacteroidaceae bacterium]|nr:N-6 DNA methylase [Bacteroidaceae bacterium]